MKNWFRRRDKGEDTADILYLTAVAQARQRVFYADLGVPDTVDGRFELVVIHVYLLLRPLKDLAQRPDGVDDVARRASAIAQALFDAMFGDMDRSLREMGVSDIAVGKRVKHMAKSFYGRVAAYDEGLAGAGDGLAKALERNLFGTVTPAANDVGAMAAYLQFQVKHLAAAEVREVLSGRLLFGHWPVKGVDR